MLRVIRCSRWLQSCPPFLATDASSSTRSQQSVVPDDDDMPVDIENPYQERPQRCILCGVKVDYKNVQLLSQFVSSFTGVPHSQKTSGLCEKKYREVLAKIRLSRHAGFMPYRTKETVFYPDPVLGGPGQPRRETGHRRISIEGSTTPESWH